MKETRRKLFLGNIRIERIYISVKVDRNKENISILSVRVGNMMPEKYRQV
jgi:hypothetical protein